MTPPYFDIAGYRYFLDQRKIMASLCLDSGEIYLPPRPICSACHSRKMRWIQLSGEGVVKAFTTISVVPTAMARQGYSSQHPYVTGFVALKEGATVAARIENENVAMHVGMSVKADFLEDFDGQKKRTTLIFRST